MQTQDATPMTADIFQSLNEDGLLTPKAIAFSLGQSERSGYRWLVDYVPSVEQFRFVLHAARPEAQRRMLGYFLDGTSWVLTQVAADMDINGDRSIDTADVVDAAIKAMQGGSQLLADARGAERSRFDSLSAADALVLSAKLDEVIQTAVAARRVVAFLSSRSSPKTVATSP
jgi:hypothetical protein